MDLSPLGVRATAGTLRAPTGVVLQHTWTADGVAAAPAANGAQLLHLSVALCVLNDTCREAERLGIEVDGIAYAVAIDSRASAEELVHLRAVVDDIAEIPRAIRAGAPVARLG